MVENALPMLDWDGSLPNPELTAARAQIDRARSYLGGLLVHYHPTCEPLPDISGVCMQIDNVMTEIQTSRARIAKLEAALRLISRQQLLTEMNAADLEFTDFESAYEQIIQDTRKALEP